MAELTIKGIYRDTLIDAGGRLLSDSGWRSNLIVVRCRMLIAGFMMNENKTFGIQQMQVGKGSAVWDTTPPVAPLPITETLVDGSPFTLTLGPSLVLQYLDEKDNVLPKGPSTRIQIVATLGPGQPPPVSGTTYPLREFGLFGKLNDQLAMIDYIRHPVIQKDTSVTLERRVRLIF
ncbi:MAG TPA: hypothetical protein VJ464_12065 [Blastocatellia bacterium]|nr:hypothetical protein [Blastocatellia bacterium]